MLLAKVATMTRPSRGSMISRKASPTVRSEGVWHWRASDTRRSARPPPSQARMWKSDSLPSTGV